MVLAVCICYNQMSMIYLHYVIIKPLYNRERLDKSIDVVMILGRVRDENTK